ncbi:MAG: DUF1700 domain-containing protein [Lachnospiraceae bacterium]|nr:DUF1700 domain-containing protein [Lachnospiraceae bacterium]MCI9204748.1 DUF1700 domain-containing protein [Lachnospiraceae bacterium]
MSRWEFMRQLEELLSDISPNEREEALQYYNDYFNDAGRENEQEVIAALGSPQQVAGIVREGLEDGGTQGEFTEKGFSSKASSLENEIMKKNQREPEDSGNGSGAARSAFSSEQDTQSAGSFEQSGGEYREPFQKPKKELPVWVIVLIVIGCIICSPLLLTVITSVLGAVFGALCTIFALILGIGLATAILFVVAVALAVAGLGCLFAHPLVGIGLLGGGLICGALGMLFLLCTVFLAGKAVPAVCRGIAWLYRCIVDRVKGVSV